MSRTIFLLAAVQMPKDNSVRQNSIRKGKFLSAPCGDTAAREQQTCEELLQHVFEREHVTTEHHFLLSYLGTIPCALLEK